MTDYEAINETESDNGMWLVRLPTGGVRAVTLEQLDEAYQNDWITGDTEVLEEGTTEWRKLSELIGDDETESASPSAEPCVLASSPIPGAEQSRYAVPSPVSLPAATELGRHQARADAASVPVAMPSVGRPAPAQSAIPVPALNSTAPVAFDLDELELGFGGSPFKRKGRRGLYVAAGLVVVLGGIGIGIASSEPSPELASAPVPGLAAASQPTSAMAQPSEPPAVEAPVPVAKDRLSEETKRALEASDKQREKQKRATTRKSRATSSRRRSGDRFSFTRGDSHDPLNGSL